MDIRKVNLGEYSRRRRLTDERKAQIRIDREKGLTYRELAIKYNVGISAISDVIKPPTEEQLAKRREYQRNYKVPREVRTERNRAMIAYKRQLVAEGKIK